MVKPQSRVAVALVLGAAILGQNQGQEKVPRFETEVLPIFQANCLGCHGQGQTLKGLDLRSRESTVKGGESGPAVVPGSVEKSLLVVKVATGAMPVGNKKLRDDQIDILRRWIGAGALKVGENAATAKAAEESVAEQEVLAGILHVKCLVCHGKRKQEGGLDLRTRASLLKGGRSGPAIIPGKPEESLLIKRISAGQMPPPQLQFPYFVREVSSDELDKLRRWIAAGAPAEEPATGQPIIREQDRKFWSFVPPQRPAVPSVRSQSSVRTPIDAFLLARLEAKGLTFSREAGTLALMRRAYFDLIGLPPSPEAVEAYIKDTSPDAYERMVERLLASKQYGERWGRYWLDAAGYADSEGGPADDLVRPFAYRYRDYVIRAFNADKPYDRFLLEQIAGDELFDWKALQEPTTDQLDSLVATGFLRMTPDPTNSHDVNFVPSRLDTIAGVIEMVSSNVMGLTMGCARCHSHKFDPIPHQDYYRFSAILRTAFDPYDWLIPNRLTGAAFDNPYAPQRYLSLVPEKERREAELHNAPIQKEIDRLEKALKDKAEPFRRKLIEEKLSQLPPAVKDDLQKALDKPESQQSETEKYLVKRLKPVVEVSDRDLERKFEEFKDAAAKLKKAIAEESKKVEPTPAVRALYDMGGDPTPVYVLRRANPFAPGQRVEPGVPSALSIGLEPYRIVKPHFSTDTSGRRLALAKWLTQPGHPLTARVMVNRIWQEHFGRGIVVTPGNFGRTGDAPSHPELLDWLATEFVREKWSIKAMHRLILRSTAYRQSSAVDAERSEKDPDNVLLSRFPLRRLDAEAFRDAILTAAGRLDPRQFGPPDDVETTAEGEVFTKSVRRSVYVLQRRETPLTLLRTFDAPNLDDSNPNCLQRAYSTVSTQALQLMNSDTVRDHSRFFASRVIDAAGDDPEKQVTRVYLAALARPPNAKELKLGVDALRDLTKGWLADLERNVPVEPRQFKARWLALATYCHMILNSPDFAYVD